MSEILTYQRESGIGPVQDRRHEPRSFQRYPVEIWGFSRHGRFFSERTFTLEVSDGGCRFSLHTEVDGESIVALRLVEKRRRQDTDVPPSLFQINWQELRPDGWTLGASKLQPGMIWHGGSSALETVW